MYCFDNCEFFVTVPIWKRQKDSAKFAMKNTKFRLYICLMPDSHTDRIHRNQNRIKQKHKKNSTKCIWISSWALSVIEINTLLFKWIENYIKIIINKKTNSKKKKKRRNKRIIKSFRIRVRCCLAFSTHYLAHYKIFKRFCRAL